MFQYPVWIKITIGLDAYIVISDIAGEASTLCFTKHSKAAVFSCDTVYKAIRSYATISGLKFINKTITYRIIFPYNNITSGVKHRLNTSILAGFLELRIYAIILWVTVRSFLKISNAKKVKSRASYLSINFPYFSIKEVPFNWIAIRGVCR